jgi:hypothetical protein
MSDDRLGADQPRLVVGGPPENVDRVPMTPAMTAASESDIRAAEGITAISMTRGPCFGTCPAYRLDLRSAGDAVFVGEAFVRANASLRGRLAPMEFARLALLVQELRFFHMDDLYLGNVDPPGLRIAVERDGTTKTVTGEGGGGPIELWTIGQLIDFTGKQIAWDVSGLDPREFPWPTRDE